VRRETPLTSRDPGKEQSASHAPFTDAGAARSPIERAGAWSSSIASVWRAGADMLARRELSVLRRIPATDAVDALEVRRSLPLQLAK